MKQQKKNPQRVNVYLDGEFAFGLSKIVAAWLKISQEISEEKIKELQSKDEIEAAYQRALTFISYRPRSIQETRNRLKKQEFPEPVIEAALTKLEEKQFLDDAKFAREWVENRAAFKPRSCFVLRRELFQKGISADLIESALSDIDDLKMAYKAAEKKAHRFSRLDQEKYQKKLSTHLASRGFLYSISAEVSLAMWHRLQSENNSKTLSEKRT